MVQPQPQEQILPRRVLVVDDDELARESIGAQLRAADFEVAVAADGEEALTMLGRQWFPVVVTDRAMPVLDGIEFVSRLRATSIVTTYVIMLTTVSDAHDYERGYCAGVDLYIVKNGQERELAAKVGAAFTAVRRRQASHAPTQDGPVVVDLESGAHSARHLVGRLHAEMARAARLSKPLQVVSVCIEPRAGQAKQGVAKAAAEALLGAVSAAVRSKIDWIAKLPAPRDSCRLAAIMPEAGAAENAAFEQGVRNAFVADANNPVLREMHVSFGTAMPADAGERPTALALLAEAERKRRGSERVPAVAAVKNVQEPSSLGS